MTLDITQYIKIYFYVDFPQIFRRETRKEIGMRFIGYVLIIIASVILASIGCDITTWQWWAISLCFIIGEFLICEGGQ